MLNFPFKDCVLEGGQKKEDGLDSYFEYDEKKGEYALHSLKKEFAGKVKLIYIDPPYNTGSDTFSYNDNFNRNSWLSFMKNRLEISKELLSPDSIIYVQLDYNQVHYAKILLDNIFGEDNFQKEMFSRLLDLNQLYVNADDRHDKNSCLSKNDITITENLYQLK